ncbi:DUF3592 domain-containing protein [uncultured Alistipes sp.]|jgi:hypothetical protein|uniref:DUF3592 domain-containing protein n=1 Tax=uncultured Alistipes sp. TaxID=538949 RepID=UPI0025FA42FA|nr:DUF3592 domain-containing protein [uncultured Alistipes sp.]
MKPWKLVLAVIAIVVILLFLAVGYSRHVRQRLDRDGIETRAVLTESFTRTEYVGYRPRAMRYRQKQTVYYFRYSFTVEGIEYTDKVRKKENLSTARIGDSVVVRYLPDDPGTHRCVKDENGKYKLTQHAPSRKRGR